MHLVQILLPLFDPAGKRFPKAAYRDVADHLTRCFGGMTGYTRAPAEGQWREDQAGVAHDDILVFEVMVETLDRAWWNGYRRELEAAFAQDVIVIRAIGIETL